jgi:hypothetical protein
MWTMDRITGAWYGLVPGKLRVCQQFAIENGTSMVDLPIKHIKKMWSSIVM